MSDELLLAMDGEELISLEEFSAASGLAREEVILLVEFGVFRPAEQAPALTFRCETILLARRAARLRDDFGLNAPGMALALTYLERIEALEHRLRELEASLPRRPGAG